MLVHSQHNLGFSLITSMTTLRETFPCKAAATCCMVHGDRLEQVESETEQRRSSSEGRSQQHQLLRERRHCNTDKRTKSRQVRFSHLSKILYFSLTYFLQTVAAAAPWVIDLTLHIWFKRRTHTKLFSKQQTLLSSGWMKPWHHFQIESNTHLVKMDNWIKV